MFGFKVKKELDKVVDNIVNEELIESKIIAKLNKDQVCMQCNY